VAVKEQLQPSNKITAAKKNEPEGRIDWSGISSAISGSMFSLVPDNVGPSMEHAFSLSQERKESKKGKTPRKK
jgi:hypothetical protein